MTAEQVLRTAAEKLRAAQIENASFDASCLVENITGLSRTKIMLCDDDIADEQAELVERAVLRRISGEPLQYILGEWEFMGLPFKVGRGVLIPRPETEILVEFAIDFLKKKNAPVVFDLCSGSGCVAISVAKFCSNATVYAVEKSDIAFEYLEKNISLNGVNNVKAVKGDMFDKELLLGISPDLILSNPPYIRSNEIEGLQEEVKREPAMALDGGEDGYIFYRSLAKDWIHRIKKSGALACECGEDQTQYICDLFSESSAEVKEYKDYSGLPRGVTVII